MTITERICSILTARQRQVLLLMTSQRLPVNEIACELGISRQATIKHMLAIYERLIAPRNADVLGTILESLPVNSSSRMHKGELCHWCSNLSEDILVFHAGECPDRRSVEIMGEETE